MKSRIGYSDVKVSAGFNIHILGEGLNFTDNISDPVLTYGGVSTLSVLTTTGGGLACKREQQSNTFILTDIITKTKDIQYLTKTTVTMKFKKHTNTLRPVIKTYSSHVLVQHVEYICYRLPPRSDSIHRMTYCTALILDNTKVLHCKLHCKVTDCFIKLCYCTEYYILYFNVRLYSHRLYDIMLYDSACQTHS